MDVRLDRVTMKFDQHTAIANLEAAIGSGELVSLLGPSGCGKSTTLFMLAGLYQPTSGKIYFGDRDVTGLPPEQRGIGMVFQNYALYPHMSVLKNIMFPLKMSKMPKKEAEARAQEMAEMVQIAHLLDRKPKQLSGGQQQRVAIARALVKRPQLLLLDEPLSNLDAQLRVSMREEIRRIQRETGITAVFVTHDQEEAMSISDKIILMNQGVVQQVSTPLEMYRQPQNWFTAGFIGSPKMNLFEATLPDGSTYKAGVRPEDVVVDEGNPLFRGEVVYCETIGRDTLAKIRVRDSGSEPGTTLLALLPRSLRVEQGTVMGVNAAVDGLHWFDPVSGERVPAPQSWAGLSLRQPEGVGAV